MLDGGDWRLEKEAAKIVHNYKKLQVYEKSYKAALSIYRASKDFPKEEMYGLTSQIRRAAVSIPLNIAEGYAKRESQSEFKRFLMMAIGSNDEVSVLLDFSKDLGYITEDLYKKGITEYIKIGKMLTELIKTVSEKI